MTLDNLNAAIAQRTAAMSLDDLRLVLGECLNPVPSAALEKLVERLGEEFVVSAVTSLIGELYRHRRAEIAQRN